MTSNVTDHLVIGCLFTYWHRLISSKVPFLFTWWSQTMQEFQFDKTSNQSWNIQMIKILSLTLDHHGIQLFFIAIFLTRHTYKILYMLHIHIIESKCSCDHLVNCCREKIRCGCWTRDGTRLVLAAGYTLMVRLVTYTDTGNLEYILFMKTIQLYSYL